MNKNLKSLALLSAVVLSCVPTASHAADGSEQKVKEAAALVTATALNVLIADSLPTKPRGVARRVFVGGAQTAFGSGVGVLLGLAIVKPISSSNANLGGLIGCLIGGFVGVAAAVDYWFSRSPSGCLRAFDSVYCGFLLSPLLRADDGEFDFVQRWVPSHYARSGYALVEAQESLVGLQVRLNKAIDLGYELLKVFSDVPTKESIARKIDVMKTYLSLVVSRIRAVQLHPEYSLQEQYKRALDRMKSDLAAEAESIRLQNQLTRLREQQNAYVQQPQAYSVYPPTAPVYVSQPTQPYARRCALCSGNLVGNKGYKTDCACLAGNYTYHHECLKTRLAQSNTCPKCHFANPKVLSDFGDGFVPSTSSVQPPVVAPTVPPVQSAAHTCALCSGDIQPTKRYRTDCNCTAGKHYYHHLCVTDALKSNGNHCPKCNKADTTVKSAF